MDLVRCVDCKRIGEMALEAIDVPRCPGCGSCNIGPIPPVKGGQGRESEEIIQDFRMMYSVLIVAVIVAMFIFSFVTLVEKIK